MHKNDIILEESDRKTNYSISIICISVILLLFIIVGYIILKELRVIVLSDSQEIFLSEILVFGFMAIFGNCSKKLPFNKYVGLRLPWTLDDCQTWRYAHMLLYELTFPTILLGITILFALPNKSKTVMIGQYYCILALRPSFLIFTAEKGINKMHDSNMKTIAGCPVLRVILFAATPISLQNSSILLQNRGL